MKRHWQFLQSYRFQKAVDLERVRKFEKVTQRSTSNSSEILMWRILRSSYNLIQAIYEELLHSQGPPRCCLLESLKRVTPRSRSNLVEILMSRTSLPVQLQHDTGKFWCIIIFIRSCKMLPLEHDLFQKVRQRSTSNSSEILMWKIYL